MNFENIIKKKTRYTTIPLFLKKGIQIDGVKEIKQLENESFS